MSKTRRSFVSNYYGLSLGLVLFFIILLDQSALVITTKSKLTKLMQKNNQTISALQFLAITKTVLEPSKQFYKILIITAVFLQLIWAI